MTDPADVTLADLVLALRHSHQRAAAAARSLDDTTLVAQSYADEWTNAQVLSHLGSGAEIFASFLAAGLAGQDPDWRNAGGPVWAVWDARTAAEQRDAFLEADAALVDALESVTPEQAAAFSLSLWAGPITLEDLARMRLGEHAVHAWDVEVALDPTAVVAQDAVALLVPGLHVVAGRAGKAQDPPFRVGLSSTDGGGDWVVDAGESVSLAPRAEGDAVDGEVSLPSEAFLRLVYGRLDPAHTPAGVAESGTRGLEDLRRVFVGF